ncbi:hypothetical protein [Photobacterium sanguinicancri]|uniref:hypothetical protein n=1 Tax=Photobacterium sanguinicancri TaxID=875932 RepID=UPI0024800702|nr:hypothetical protein [Photobacterium sanguinicancri]
MKVRTEVRSVIFRRLYLDACELFPNNKLVVNSDLASSVTQELLELEIFNLDVDKESVKSLIASVDTDGWVNQNIANYHRLTAFYYSYGNSGNLHTEQVEGAMLKAQKRLLNCDELDEDGIKKLYKDVKQEKKLLRKRIGSSNKQRIEQEKRELISPITITATHFSVALTLVSTLFVISGFLYTKSFFYWFDVNVGDFYTVQDYLSSSIDVISSTAFSAFIGLLSIAIGLSTAWSDELHDGQFDVTERRKNYMWPFILITSALGLAVSVYTTGMWPNIFIFPLILSLSMYLYFRLPIWNYIENRAPVGIACLVVLFFFMHLGFKVKENVEGVIYDNYEPRYSITFESKFQKYSNFPYLTSNSNFVFLLNKENKKVVILPKNSVHSFEVNG